MKYKTKVMLPIPGLTSEENRVLAEMLRGVEKPKDTQDTTQEDREEKVS